MVDGNGYVGRASLGGFALVVALAFAFVLALAFVLVVGPERGARPAEAQSGARPDPATGTGLSGEYFHGVKFGRYAGTGAASAINYNWGSKGPRPKVGPDKFSARWNGLIEAPVDGVYKFEARASDGVRLWVDDKLVIGSWRASRAARTSAGGIQLKGGERHRIRLEYFEHTGKASARLSWSVPGSGKTIVPKNRLYASNAGQPKVEQPEEPESPPDTSPEPPSGYSMWSDPATWGGSVPAAGDEVAIPSDKRILLDESPPQLKNLTVMGELKFADRDISLSADWILVHGKFVVGEEDDPYLNEATITLTGNDESVNVMRMGNKFLGAMGGSLELHGEERASKTILTQTAEKGANRLTVEDASSWRVGDEIAIASTDYHFDHAEERTITAKSGDTLTLDAPLEYMHWGTLQTFAGETVDQRAEVGLLSRNIKIQGDEESDGSGYGAHVMAMQGGEAHVSGVEITKAGQKSVLARYPFHFHMLKDAGEGSYIENSSIHDTYNRCITIHATNYTRVSDNVCYDNVGHAFFMEDGNEHGNLVEDNLGMLTKRPAQGEGILPHENVGWQGAATYWITNPDNTYRNNIAAGSENFGFWFALPEHPVGPSYDDSIWPNRTPIKEFSNNKSHSNNKDGLRLDEILKPDGSLGVGHYTAREEPADEDSPTVVSYFRDLESYKNRDHGVWVRGENMEVVGATLSDNRVGAAFPGHEVHLEDSLAVGTTANNGNPEAWERSQGALDEDGGELPIPWEKSYPITGFDFYDGLVGVSGATFVNYQSNGVRKAAGLGNVRDNAFPFNQGNYARDLKFVNSNRVWLGTPRLDGDKGMLFRDLDGSVTGSAGGVVTSDNPFLATEDKCDFREEWNARVCVGHDYAALFVSDMSGSHAGFEPLTITRSDGIEQEFSGMRESRGEALTNLVTEGEYEVEFSVPLPRETQYAIYRSAGKTVDFKVKVPSDDFKVVQFETDGYPPHKSGSLGELHGDRRTSYYYDRAAGYVHFRLAEHGQYESSEWEEVRLVRTD